MDISSVSKRIASSDDKTAKMMQAITDRLGDDSHTFDTNQQAQALLDSGFSQEDVDEFFDELEPF